MHFVKLLLMVSIVVQVYYLYEFIYSIPMRRDGGSLQTFKRGETEATNLRGTYNFLEKHKQKSQLQQHPKQMTNGNNTALIYKLATTLRAVYPF